jgi:hypothetical protein
MFLITELKMTGNLAEITRLYQSIASSVTKTQNYFSTDEYRKLEQANETAFEKIEPLCNSLIGILQGKNNGEDIDLPEAGNKIGFYTRILRKQPEALSSSLKEEIDGIIEDSFLLGLICHLYLYDNPARNGFEKVDAADVIKKLAPNIMSSSGKMRKYDKKLNTIPILIFENYYDNHIAPVLNSKLDLGLLQCASARNYFTNLFFSGARFGEMLDKATV